MSKFVSPNLIYQDALKKKYAVGAFSVTSAEIMQGVINVARKEKTPFIASISNIFFSEIGDLEAFIQYLQFSIRDLDIPVALHLDHGISPASLKDICKFLSYGFTSVMFDGSDLPLAKNIEETRKAVEIFHDAGIAVEGSLGKVPYGEMGELESKSILDHSVKRTSDYEKWYTDPDEAEQFVNHTGVDALAVSVGTVHGLHPQNIDSKIDIDRVKEIRKKTNTFLVVHGGSGTPLQEIKKMIAAGIVKLNIASDIYSAILDNYKEKIAEEKRPIYKYGTIEVIENIISRYVKIFMSNYSS
jgi:ketose-bisphosphate aldolase